MKLILVLLICLQFSESIRFHLPSNGRKCIKDEVHQDILVTGEYDVQQVQNIPVSIDVQDAKQHILFQKSDISKGKFSFSVESYDIFEVCFTTKSSNTNVDLEVFLDLKHGTDAKNYENLLKTKKLMPIEIELRMLEDATDTIAKDFIAMHERSESMRYTNASTHSRVLYFSIFSIIFLVLIAVCQVVYLKKYFKSKKLID